MPRSYQNSQCHDCGRRVTSNGMGRDAHEHSRVHVDALRERLRTAESEEKRNKLQTRIDKLEREMTQRRERREAHRK